MIKISHAATYNWEGAIRGMRNPMNSWEKSDSKYCNEYLGCTDCPAHRDAGYCEPLGDTLLIIGKNDLDLMKKLAKAGSDHRKFMRQIFVSVDITAPLYWWKEFDTYKVGTTANSCSTMHKVHAKEFTVDDFSFERTIPICSWFITSVLNVLNTSRERFLETKDKVHWDTMIQFLPSSYNQKRTITMSYENLVNMYHARKNHKLDEWREFCGWIEGLPYSEIITGVKE